MRIWSLHPKYLDKKELVSSWNDGLKALKILAENHQRYIFRPELSRFRSQGEPVAAIERYLMGIAREAKRRHYRLKAVKLPPLSSSFSFKIPVSEGQIEYEWHQLMQLLANRNPKFMRRIEYSPNHDINPVFFKDYDKNLETWEKLT